MIWYRSHAAYMAKFGRALQPPMQGDVAESARLSSGGGGEGAPPNYAVEGYLEAQGRKFISRFDAKFAFAARTPAASAACPVTRAPLPAPCLAAAAT